MRRADKQGKYLRRPRRSAGGSVRILVPSPRLPGSRPIRTNPRIGEGRPGWGGPPWPAGGEHTGGGARASSRLGDSHPGELEPEIGSLIFLYGFKSL